MKTQRAVWTVQQGPNRGDVIRVENGACRLIGRHLSENETALMSPDGHRVLDSKSNAIFNQVLKQGGARKHTAEHSAPDFQPETFKRGADVIFGDDTISRAHAMVFCDGSGTGIIDLASTNGSFLNGQRISSALVREGDEISLGDSILTATLETVP